MRDGYRAHAVSWGGERRACFRVRRVLCAHRIVGAASARVFPCATDTVRTQYLWRSERRASFRARRVARVSVCGEWRAFPCAASGASFRARRVARLSVRGGYCAHTVSLARRARAFPCAASGARFPCATGIVRTQCLWCGEWRAFPCAASPATRDGAVRTQCADSIFGAGRGRVSMHVESRLARRDCAHAVFLARTRSGFSACNGAVRAQYWGPRDPSALPRPDRGVVPAGGRGVFWGALWGTRSRRELQGSPYGRPQIPSDRWNYLVVSVH